jgi:succinate dehydrogenase/fumarate reductase flavoprotein subunit
MKARRGAVWFVMASLMAAPPRKPADTAASADLVIVGAGPAGLAAALEAASQGAAVTLVEWSSVPGGAAIHSDAAGVVTLYRRVLTTPGIRFLPSHRVERIVSDHGTVTGVEAASLREKSRVTVRGKATLLATGGFAGNASILRSYLPPELAPDSRVLLGGGWRARGQGVELAISTGAGFVRMNRLWLAPDGVIDSNDVEGDRGLRLPLSRAVWVSPDGQRMGPAQATSAQRLQALLAQTGQTAWLVFDAESRAAFLETPGPLARRLRMEKLLSDDNRMLRGAGRLDTLASLTGIPAGALMESVTAHNKEAAARDRIEIPPYYALAVLPIAMANYGGLSVDERGQVRRSDGGMVPGLFAAGEAAGFGPGDPAGQGNKLTALAEEMGRATARSAMIVTGIQAARPAVRAPAKQDPPPAYRTGNKPCFTCHETQSDVLLKREGWWHYEQVHTLVMKLNLPCAECHGSLAEPTTAGHRQAPAGLLPACLKCHVAQEAKP